MSLLLLIHAAATLFMTGVIWFVQIVHYPLMARVGQTGFAAYETAHTRLTSYVVVPPMLVELATALFLLFRRPASIALSAAVAGAALLAVVWISTFALQVPQHNRLLSGFDSAAHRRLVSTNWIRTISWTVRSILALCFLCWTS